VEVPQQNKKKGSLGTKLPRVEVSKKGESGAAHPPTPVEGESSTTKLPHTTKKNKPCFFLVSIALWNQK